MLTRTWLALLGAVAMAIGLSAPGLEPQASLPGLYSGDEVQYYPLVPRSNFKAKSNLLKSTN